MLYIQHIYIYIHVVQHNEVWFERISGRKKIELLAEKDWSLQSSRHGIISSSNFPAMTCNGTSWIPISPMPFLSGKIIIQRWISRGYLIFRGNHMGNPVRILGLEIKNFWKHQLENANHSEEHGGASPNDIILIYIYIYRDIDSESIFWSHGLRGYSFTSGL